MTPTPTRRRPTWWQRATFAMALASYVMGYGAVRYDHLLVHGVSYVGGQDPAGPVIADHEIKGGDFGVPVFGLGTAFATMLAGVIFWPLTRAELGYWYLVQPSGSPYEGRVDPPSSWDALPPPPLPASEAPSP